MITRILSGIGGVVLIFISVVIYKRKVNSIEDDIISRGKKRGGFLGWCCSKTNGVYGGGA